MPAAVLDDISEILKTIYTDEVPEIGFKDNVLWGILPKVNDFKGRYKSLANRFGRTPGVSNDFGTAQGNAGASPYAEFLLTRSKSYGVVQFDGELFEAAESPGAQIKYVTDEVNSAFKNMLHRLNRNLYRNHGGAIGTIASGIATTTITMDEPTDLIGLEVGMYVVTAGTDGTSGSADANAVRVVGIDRVAGTVELSAALAGGSDGDYLFVQGDFGLAAYGLDEWLPATAPDSTLFFNCDRSRDPLRLGGQRIAAVAGDTTLENFLDRAATECYLQGGRPSKIVMNPRHVGQLRRELGQSVEYTKVPVQTSKGAHASMGFKSIGLVTAHMDMEVLADRDCPLNVGYMLDMSTIEWSGLKSSGPRVLTYGGGEYLRMADEDALEGRIGWRGQLGIREPGCNARLDLTALV